MDRGQRVRERALRVAVGLGAAVARTVLALALASGGAVAAGAQDDDGEAASLAEAWTDGKFSLGFRLRYEEVDDDNPPVAGDRARALTLRTTAGYQTKPWHGLSFHFELEDVSALGGDSRYNNGSGGGLANGVTGRPVIADPDLTEVNQVRLIWSDGDGTTIDVGRRELNLGNERFVGSVGWRQNHQAVDAFTIANRSLDRVSFHYSYLDAVHRVTGDTKPMTSHLLNVVAGLEPVTLTAYVYALDYQRAADAGLSTTTLGLRAEGRHRLGADAPHFLYDLELAEQRDAADNPGEVDAGYLRLEAGVGWKPLSLRLGREVLGGERGQGAFQTPLATLHKWNGWADKFLVTPADGLEDDYANLSGKAGPFSWTVVYHRFEADSTGAHYGDELDLEGSWRSPWKQVISLKAARYDADELFFDTDKYFALTSWGF